LYAGFELVAAVKDNLCRPLARAHELRLHRHRSGFEPVGGPDRAQLARFEAIVNVDIGNARELVIIKCR